MRIVEQKSNLLVNTSNSNIQQQQQQQPQQQSTVPNQNIESLDSNKLENMNSTTNENNNVEGSNGLFVEKEKEIEKYSNFTSKSQSSKLKIQIEEPSLYYEVQKIQK